MRTPGIDEAVRAAGGVGALARALGISQPAVSSWQRIPADRVVAVESITGIPRATLRPDLYADAVDTAAEIDDVDLLRAQNYGLLSVLLGRAPTAELLGGIAELSGDGSPLGRAYLALAAAAREADAAAVSREYFDLFIGVGRGELLPYASYYLTGFLNERPLAHVRQDMIALDVERSEATSDPEDHLAILFETMAGLASGRIAAEPDTESRFFAKHIQPWAARFFADLETAKTARFYRHVGSLGRLYVEIEEEAFAIGA